MKQTITLSQFRDAFQSIRPDNFSYEGLAVLYDFFEELDADCGTESELDVIAICCDFSESTQDEIINDYDIDGFRESIGSFDDWRIYGDREQDVLLDYMNEQTLVAGVTESGNIVYVAF